MSSKFPRITRKSWRHVSSMVRAPWCYQLVQLVNHTLACSPFSNIFLTWNKTKSNHSIPPRIIRYRIKINCQKKSVNYFPWYERVFAIYKLSLCRNKFYWRVVSVFWRRKVFTLHYGKDAYQGKKIKLTK